MAPKSMTRPSFLPQFNRNIWLILCNTAVVGFAVEGGVYSVLFNIYLLRLDYGAQFVGIVNSVGNFAYALAALLAGVLGQRWGVRRLILLGISLATVAGLLIPIAPAFDGALQSATFLLIVTLRNVGNVMILVGSTPYIMSFASGQTLTRAFALDSAFYGTAAFAGAWLGGLLPSWIASNFDMSLTDADPYRYAFISVVIALFVGVSVVSQTEPSPTAAQQTSTDIGRTLREMPHHLRRTILIFSGISILGGFGTGVAYIFSNVYFDEALRMPTSLIGQLQAFASLIGVGSVLLLPRWVKRWSLFRATFTTYIVLGLSIIVIGLTDSWWVAGGGFVVAIGLNSLRFATYRMYTMRPIPEKFQAIASGMFNAGIGIGFAITAVASGFLVAQTGFPLLFTIGGCLVLATAGLFWLYEFRRGDQDIS